jgi:hypothetical protein
MREIYGFGDLERYKQLKSFSLILLGQFVYMYRSLMGERLERQNSSIFFNDFKSQNKVLDFILHKVSIGFEKGTLHYIMVPKEMVHSSRSKCHALVFFINLNGIRVLLISIYQIRGNPNVFPLWVLKVIYLYICISWILKIFTVS